MSNVRLDISKEFYSDLYQKHGLDEKSLGWTKNKQNIRFEQILRYIDSRKISVLDVGCGFGDLYQYIQSHEKLSEIEYYGIDIMESFIEIAKKNYEEEQERFHCCALSELSTGLKYDWVVECGMFGVNVAETEEQMYVYIAETMKKAFEIAKPGGGISFYFLSDKVDYRSSTVNFHASPEKILGIAYGLSRRVILDNSIMPFEFCITVWKNDRFLTDTTVFASYYQKE